MTLLWPSAGFPQVLFNSCAHVWAWGYSGIGPDALRQLTALLSLEERKRMSRFHFERDRVRYAICHGNLRHLLSSYLHLQPSQLQFEENEHGRPELAGDDSGLSFNLSHSFDMALLAVGRGLRVGVDVEQIRPIEADVAEQHFSARELLELGDLSGQSWVDGFYNCWTRKEAILKAEGVGLSVRLDAFDVALVPGAPPRLIAHRPDAGLRTEWILSALKPSGDAVGALATSDTPLEVRCWQLAPPSLL